MTELFKHAAQVFQNNFQYIVKVSAPFAFLAFPSYFSSQPTEENLAFTTITGLLLYLIGFSVYMATLIFFLSQNYQKNLASVKSNIINGLVYSPPLMVTLILSNAPIIAVGVILFAFPTFQAAALPLLILGIYVSLKATFAPFHLILEGENPLVSIVHSFRSTRGYLSKIIGILFLFYLATSIVGTLSEIETGVELLNALLFFLGIAATFLMVAFQQIVVFKIYIDSFGNQID